ncbi:MAG: ferrous iron transport protein A [Spirochaetota bacterium]|nr:MAG: ferrous iron transport protein A [Spirochaetota bacterium]
MENKTESIPLDMVGEGLYRIITCMGGKGFVRKLAHMGLYPGSELRVLSSNRYGPLRVNIKGSHVGLGRGMASKILVNEIVDEKKFTDIPITLRDYKEGQKGKIIDVRGAGKFKKRIIEMGFIKGVEVYVEKYAPLRDPIEFIVKGYHVGLRRDEAEKIIMTEPW